MIDIILRDAITFANLLTLLSIGLSLTYMTTKIPNFAHGSFATLGIYIALTITELWKLNIYTSLLIAPFFGGLAALSLYKFILKPLMNKGASLVSLMIATLAFDLVLLSFLNIYADYLTKTFKIKSRVFNLRGYDLKIGEYPAIFPISLILSILLIIILHLLLTKTKFGISMRATIENPSLASVMGINTDLVYSTSWFIAGSLAGIAGCLLPIRFIGNPDTGTTMIASIFAASIVGGLLNIYGAILGGYLIGLTEVLGTNYLAMWFGSWIIPYRPIIPLIAMVITLLLAPKGLSSINWYKIIKKFGSEKNASC
jgi:branched-chain amino acid transport system permease protein